MRNGRLLADIERWLRLPEVIEKLGASRVDMHRKEVEREQLLTLAEAAAGCG
jgi:predicted DNA-binding transcriptional regulator AlpA